MTRFSIKLIDGCPYADLHNLLAIIQKGDFTVQIDSSHNIIINTE